MFPGLVLTHKPDALKHIPCGAPWCLCSSAVRDTQQEFNRDTTFLLQHTLSTRNRSSCETMGWTRQHPASGGWFSEWDPVPRCTQDDTKAKQVTLQQPKTTTLHLLKLFQSYFHVAGESFMFRKTFCFPNFICQHSFIQFFPSQKPWLKLWNLETSIPRNKWEFNYINSNILKMYVLIKRSCLTYEENLLGVLHPEYCFPN